MKRIDFLKRHDEIKNEVISEITTILNKHGEVKFISDEDLEDEVFDDISDDYYEWRNSNGISIDIFIASVSSENGIYVVECDNTNFTRFIGLSELADMRDLISLYESLMDKLYK